MLKPKMEDYKLDTQSFYNPKTKIWSGSKKPLTYTESDTIGAAVLAALLKDPQHISQICHHNGKKYTSEEIATWSIRIAQHFQALDLNEGDIIGICCANSDFVAPLVFGSLFEGCAISTLDPSFQKDGIKHIYSLTQPKLMFCDGSNYGRVKEAFEELGLESKIYTMMDHIEGVPEITELLQETGKEKEYKLKTLKDAGNTLAGILCSSGTTGLPKGVCLSHVALLNALFISPMYSCDVLVTFSTLYWLSGLLCLLTPTIKGATRVINAKGFSAKDFFEIIHQHKVSLSFAPPSQIALCLSSPHIADYDFSSMKIFLTGGSAIPFPLIQQMRPYFPNAQIIAGYGMSELASAISLGPINTDSTNGALVPFVEAKVVNSLGEALGPKEVGEVWIKTPFKWHGYYKNPEATKEIYDEEGWVHSGDLGYFSPEGELFIVDRIKDILKYNNFHFYPTEIEKVICELPGVSEVCVCGLPDIVSSFLPTAAVVKMNGSTLREEQVMDYVARHMDHFKQLRGGVYFLEELPKTPSGKVLRREVVRICQELQQRKVAAG